MVLNIINVEFSEFNILVNILVSSVTTGGATDLVIETLDVLHVGNLGEGLGMLNIIFICVYLFVFEIG
jgi:hypothetical protein